jgi:hypothetical protein
VEIFRAPSGVQEFRILEDRRDERRRDVQCRMSNFPLVYVLNEDQFPLMDWKVDELPLWK